MKISIYSRKDWEQVLGGKAPENSSVIQFIDPEDRDEAVLGRQEHTFSVAVADISYDELEDYGQSYDRFFPEAEELSFFIYSEAQEGRDLICRCEYGQGRSAGCAAAILEFYYGNGISIFSDYRYCPNQMIYHKLYDGLKKRDSVSKLITYVVDRIQGQDIVVRKSAYTEKDLVAKGAEVRYDQTVLLGKMVGHFYQKYGNNLCMDGYDIVFAYPLLFVLEGTFYLMYQSMEDLEGETPMDKFIWAEEVDVKNGPISVDELHRIILE